MTKEYFDGAIVVNPEILGGTPVFAGTRVPMDNLFEWLGAGDDVEAFLRSFPAVRREYVVRVLKESATDIEDARQIRPLFSDPE